MRFRFAIIAIAAIAPVVLTGCPSYIDGLPLPGDMSAPDLSAEVDLAGLDLYLYVPPDLTGCTPTVDCSGKCGPIFDVCLGRNVQCGACNSGMVCDLVNHVCIQPQTTCAQLNAQCGIIKNSCGVRLNCPACPNGQECDPDTNRCIACKNVTCEQLGYECGNAWLGCGPTTNLSYCGDCPSGKQCNPLFNKCEPTCVPPSAATLCAAAKSARGVECGIITDGCGGYVDCSTVQGFGCPAGQQCGGQGEPNRCGPKEQPTECIAAGRECGEIDSVCGGKVSCGTCTPPQVCNSNGRCGPPCTEMTCAQLGNPECGTVPDGCGGQKRCNDCPNTTQYACINNKCCKKKTCAADYAGQCGTGLDDGCGGTLDCTCASGACTAMMSGVPGMCCVNTATCPTNACNTSVTNTCTGQPIPCTCNPTTQYCNTATNTCVPKNTCTTYDATGTDGKPCSNGPAFSDGAGGLFPCNCTGGRYCINGTPPGPVAMGSQIGACCTDTNACIVSGVQFCNTTRMNACTGQMNVCGGCPNGQNCGPNNQCRPNFTCSTYGANGQAGQPCSNGANPNWPNGNGGNLTCPCSGGRLCITGSPPSPIASGSQEGTCCQNTATCPAGVCNPTNPPLNTCTGQPLSCGCPSNQYCSGPNGTCMPKNTCTSLGKTGAVGSKCNTFRSTFYDDGTGNKIACPCSTSGGMTNNTCVGQTPTTEGTCTCTPRQCTSCADHGQPDGCGSTLNCACTGGTVCFNNSCCTKKTCANLPAGVPAGSCGAFNDGCGGGFSCSCPTTHPTTGLPMPNQMCVPVSGSNPPYGTCQCVPTPCTVLGVGVHPNNGCGQPVTCSS